LALQPEAQSTLIYIKPTIYYLESEAKHMSLFKPLRGNRDALDAQPLHDGYAYFCSDGSFHIDGTDESGNLKRKQITASKTSAITLQASGWTTATNVYSQVVTVPGSTANSKVDIYPTPEQLIELQSAGIALVAVNEDGVITVYALNNKPASDYSMQVTLTELSGVV
jgi:hypothetical protein